MIVQHHLFAEWVRLPYNHDRFYSVLCKGERIVGEWLAQAHGTRYRITLGEPFVCFDIMVDDTRLPFLPFLHKSDSPPYKPVDAQQQAQSQKQRPSRPYTLGVS